MNDIVLNDFIKRTKGEFYLGVVGSVRSGKSTFIKKFMELKILPYIKDDVVKNKIIDELPQTQAGKNIMTVEPKFIPSNTVSISLEEKLEMNVRLVDSVGFVIPKALGHFDEEGPRMVHTPWFEEAIPFKEAAEIGTKKVIQNHSTLGIMITSDGSFGEFTRSDYKTIEPALIDELKTYNKPFVVILNSKRPNDKETLEYKKEIEDEYLVTVLPINIEEMTNKDIDNILKSALVEFKIEEMNIFLPNWIDCLNSENKIKKEIDDFILNSTKNFKRFKDAENIKDKLKECPLFSEVEMTKLDPSEGKLDINVEVLDSLYDDLVNELAGDTIQDKGDFIKMLLEYNELKNDFGGLKVALEEAKQTGYGVALPNIKDMTLEKPEIIKQQNRYGVKIKAKAPSLHLIRVDVNSTFEPIIGTEEQCKALIENLITEDESNLEQVWNSEIFGRKLKDLVVDGMKSKLYQMPSKVQLKLKDTLEKIINKGTGTLIAILL